jgi:hypothetical protein
LGGGKNTGGSFTAQNHSASKSIAKVKKTAVLLRFDFRDLWKVIANENRKLTKDSKEEKFCLTWCF